MKLLVDMNLSPRWVELLDKAVVDALLQMTAELERGALLTVDPSRARLRVLPLIPEA
jgi:predicted nuclease of predicted toxin-antitoxin system